MASCAAFLFLAQTPLAGPSCYISGTTADRLTTGICARRRFSEPHVGFAVGDFQQGG